MTEQQPHELVHRYPHFELRRYPAHVVAEVHVHATVDRAGYAAFRHLFSYIRGSNTARQKLAMTAPVIQAGGPSEKLAMTAPVVQSGPLPGSCTGAAFARRNTGLQAALTLAGLTPVGPPRFARFDPPFKPWFLRHNEVIQDVQGPSSAPETPGGAPA
jgi:hypothetical protein